MRLVNHLFTHQSLTWADSVRDMAAAAYAGLPRWCELSLTAIRAAKLPDRSVAFKSLRRFNNPERRQAELSKARDRLRTCDLGNYRCKTKRASSCAVPHFSELLGIVQRKQRHTQQEDDVAELRKHTCSSPKTSPLLLRLMQCCWKP